MSERHPTRIVIDTPHDSPCVVRQWRLRTLRDGRALPAPLFTCRLRFWPAPLSFILDARIASPITKSSGLVTLIFSPLPSTTATEYPSHSTKNASSVARTPSACALHCSVSYHD